MSRTVWIAVVLVASVCTVPTGGRAPIDLGVAGTFVALSERR